MFCIVLLGSRWYQHGDGPSWPMTMSDIEWEIENIEWIIAVTLCNIEWICIYIEWKQDITIYKQCNICSIVDENSAMKEDCIEWTFENGWMIEYV